MSDKIWRLVRRGLRTITGPLRTALLRSAVKSAPRVRVQGFHVVNISESRDDLTLFTRTAEALRLIADTDPRILPRMRKVVRRIVMVPSAGSAGAYWQFLHACVLDAGHVLTDSAAAIAMTLVHEAAHARLHRAGVRYHEAMQARIEASCVKAEIAFARRLPGTEHLVAAAERALLQSWWCGASQRERKNKQLRTLGCPEWMVRLANTLFG